MANATQNALQRAIEYLDAVEVAKPGDHTPDGGLVMQALYAFQPTKAADYWAACNAETLLAYARASREFEKLPTVTRMPEWWSPTQQYAYGIVKQNGTEWQPNRHWRCAEKDDADALALSEPELRVHRVTVDLETGEEVEA